LFIILGEIVIESVW